MTKAKKAARQMHVFKAVSRVKVKGERRYPYRVIGVPLDADLLTLAGAILDAFDFDQDHAFGFFDTKNPYRANRRYELFADLRGAEGGGMNPLNPFAPPAPSPELPEEADLALMLGLETVDRRALMHETADFLTGRLAEELLPRVPERLRDEVGERLTAFTAETLSLEEEEEEDFRLPLPPEARALLEQPGGLEQVMGMFLTARDQLAGGALPGTLGGGLGSAGSGGAEEQGLTGVPVTVPFGQQPTWTFLFDYGDDWTFDVTYQGVQDAPPRVRLPHVLETLGTAPEQYPEWEE